MTTPGAPEKEAATSEASEAEEEEYQRMESVPVEEEDTAEEDSAVNKEESEEAAATPEVTKEEEDPAAIAEPKMEFLDTSSYAPDEPQDLKHNLQPGDHVIRWEMTVIAWPIQIHGIVLEVGKQYVELADFGLTAQPQKEVADKKTPVAEAKAEEEEEVEEEATSETPSHHHVHQQAPFMDHPVAQKMEDAVSSAWNKLRKEKHRPKQRITVHIITTQKELNRWHKINYGSKLFGIGGGDGDDNTALMDEDGSDQTTKKPSLADKFKNSLKFGKARQQQPSSSQEDNNITTTHSGSPSNSPKKFPRIRAASAKMNTSMQHIKNDPRVKNVNEKTAQGLSRIASLWTPKRQQQQHPNDIHSNSASLDDQDTTCHSLSTEEQQQQQQQQQQEQVESNTMNGSSTDQEDGSSKSSSELSNRHMNPAMAKLLAEKAQREKEEQSKDSSSDKDATPKAPKNKLPKSDPPKLVLARANFLLKHGESILPPYHAFHSNSECIAVFCKTGIWSTLQAAVFLHSTAIGNAKSTMAVTLGVAASVPVLAPVIGGIGLAMVGAPWLILKESKGKWEDATRKLTDLFWAQAEPEVFVECIEHWSGLVPRPGSQHQQKAIEASCSQASLASSTNLSKVEESKHDDGDDMDVLEQAANGSGEDNGMNPVQKDDSEEKLTDDANGDISATASPPANNYRLASV